MNKINLSEWALTHRAFTGFLMALLMLGGIFSYFKLGQREDPEFNFRVMIVKTLYPGATALEVEQQITDRLENKLLELPNLDYIQSYSKPGESVLFVTLREDVSPRNIPNLWYQVRKKIDDIKSTLPPGVIGPLLNDEFGDTYSLIYAFAGEGFGYAELKTWVDSARQQVFRIENVGKIDLFGTQDEKIFIEFSDKKLAQLGLNLSQIEEALRLQNSLVPTGTIITSKNNLPIRITGSLDSVGSIARLPLRVDGRTFNISDFATVTRGYTDPPLFKMRFNGREVIGMGITLNKHGDIFQLEQALAETMARIQADLPLGITLEKVSDQSRVVEKQMHDFKIAFMEALIAVLAVSFFALGLRAGLVVALTVPLVLAGTLLVMLFFNIELHRVSLGALILALGLLVDDAMIAIEMMARKLDEGWNRLRAAIYAYRTTAMPMLTGTLITIAGFLPVGLAQSQAGEYTVSILQVIGIALLLSWIFAVIFTPYLGYLVFKFNKDRSFHDRFDTPFYHHLRQWITACVTYRFKVIAGTLIFIAMSCFAFTQVSQQFFPQSNRPEIMMDMWLPEGGSFARSEAIARRMEAILSKDKDVVNYVAYAGAGSPRFFLPIAQQLANINLIQFVILTKDNVARERVILRLRQIFATDFPEVRGRTMRLRVGPPMDYPLLFRVFGEEPEMVRKIADQVARIVSEHPHTVDVNDDWHDRIPSYRLELDQEKARALGISTAELSQALQAHYTGITIGQLREDNKLIDIVLRSHQLEKTSELPDVVIRTGNGVSVPLSQLVRIETIFEDGVRWRRNRFPAISVRADVIDGILAPDVATHIMPKLKPIEATLPSGYYIEVGAAKEDAWVALRSVLIWTPFALTITIVLLMIHLQNLSRAFLVFLTTPLGIIGAAFSLLLFDAPFGFLAMLGTIALAGMIMRNSVILVDQIVQEERAGQDTWNAIIESTVRRFRPIMLTAAATILAMIPLSMNDFFYPMAIAIMGGLTVATVLTIFFLPALYAAWFKVNPPGPEQIRPFSNKIF